MSRSNDEAGCFLQIIAGVFILVLVLFIQATWANSGKMTVNAKVLDTFIKMSDGSSQYLVSLSVDGNVEPFEVENNLFIGRLDKTTVYAQIEQLKGRCVSANVHGFRIPSISFRGLTAFREIECSSR
jgi:hypothetical protein